MYSCDDWLWDALKQLVYQLVYPLRHDLAGFEWLFLVVEEPEDAWLPDTSYLPNEKAQEPIFHRPASSYWREIMTQQLPALTLGNGR